MMGGLGSSNESMVCRQGALSTMVARLIPISLYRHLIVVEMPRL